MKRLKVLVNAHELSPYNGSECAVGWNFVTRLAKYHDVTVLHASGSQFHHNSYVNALNRYFQTAAPVPGLTFRNIDKPAMSRLMVRINAYFKKLTPVGLPFLYYIGYKYWQKAAYREAKRMHEKEPFDIAHQLTQITFREPGYLWKLGIPFFWGPTGGTATFPKTFYKDLSGRSKLLERIRRVSNFYQFKFTGRVSKANKKAAVIYTFSKVDAARLKKRARGEVKIMLDVGTYPRAVHEKTKPANPGMIKGIWCGRISDYKAPAILLNALGKESSTRNKVQFVIIGKGALETEMSKLASELQLQHIEWIKEVKHDDIFEMMGNADFLVHTSLREATSSVIPEALSMGLPVICHDAYGMGMAINEECGIKVPLVSPADSVNGFHEAIRRLAAEPGLLEKLKQGAVKRSAEISWDKLAETMANDYLAIIENHQQ